MPDLLPPQEARPEDMRNVDWPSKPPLPKVYLKSKE